MNHLQSLFTVDEALDADLELMEQLDAGEISEEEAPERGDLLTRLQRLTYTYVVGDTDSLRHQLDAYDDVAAAAKRRKDELHKIEQRHKKKAQRLKALIQICMEERGDDKWISPGSLRGFRLQESAPSLHVYDDALVPDQFKEWLPQVKKDELKEALLAQDKAIKDNPDADVERIPGATILRGKHLRKD